ncbi:NAD-dependent epimerase/dehydratase family protein [Mucilaginibacter agri]|uniref:NAD-dependent epimerase/dehydratase family protein n=1 Tax=Mucilaginibacter agri TaxID=2695265 RepID=A0A965ZIT6_9SPHI|nr:NAD-dependent epimerase/dehydratase family protein [Mucilaginibacter agri]NCD70754.1 NAD-dependent epimerase/dehydratase family protein [Mucilaginibacter agri]
MMNKIIEEDLLSIYDAEIDWELFTNKTVFITGASGFLPIYMVRTLLYLNRVKPLINVNVITLVRNKEKAEQKFAEFLTDDHLKILVQDVCTPVTLTEKIDYIIHAASQASPKYYGADPVGTLNANVTGTLNMLELARKNDVISFLYFSSGEVYGHVTNEHNPVKENYYGYLDPTMVRACYGESKRMGENMCVSYAHQYGVNAKIVRPFHTYGPGMDLNDGRVYADFIADVLAGRNIQMKSDGLATRAFCYLKDATIGFFTVLLKGKNSEAYNVGNPDEEYSIIKLAEIVAGLGTPPLKVIRVSVKADNSYLNSPLARNTPNIDKMKNLGWMPSTGVVEGFKKALESYC